MINLSNSWYRSVGIIFRDNRPLLLRSLQKADGKVVDAPPDDSNSGNSVDIEQLNWIMFTALDGVDVILRKFSENSSKKDGTDVQFDWF